MLLVIGELNPLPSRNLKWLSTDVSLGSSSIQDQKIVGAYTIYHDQTANAKEAKV